MARFLEGVSAAVRASKLERKDERPPIKAGDRVVATDSCLWVPADHQGTVRGVRPAGRGPMFLVEWDGLPFKDWQENDAADIDDDFK